MKKDYEKPELEVVKLETVDVITISYTPGEDETPLVPAGISF